MDEAIFTAPAHPFWGGAGLIGADGKLLGIGSLHVEQAMERGQQRDVNMIVPIDLLPPILDDLLSFGRVDKPPRPWLGVYSTESDGKIIVVGVAEHGPAAAAWPAPGRHRFRRGEFERRELGGLLSQGLELRFSGRRNPHRNRARRTPHLAAHPLDGSQRLTSRSRDCIDWSAQTIAAEIATAGLSLRAAAAIIAVRERRRCLRPLRPATHSDLRFRFDAHPDRHRCVAAAGQRRRAFDRSPDAGGAVPRGRDQCADLRRISHSRRFRPIVSCASP